ncbi:extracellular solute-binding protein [Amycolatopsis sp. NPDC049253]|uniref:extracellular solute-binding protein n=1 Tax=Amycolatopsis sp. NPDC049253 TaxID=3155274 RepID=UPI0034353B73
MARNLSRRTLLRVGGASALGLAALPLLDACSSGSTTTSAAASAKVKLPTYVPVNAVKPDLPGNAQGAMDAYFTYPANPKPAFSTPPAQGLGEVRIMYPTYNPIPPGMNSNSWWQELNREVGATLNFQFTTASDYPTKFQTTIAGSDLPDVMIIPSPVPDKPRLLSRVFEDLTPYLSGDAVKQFPFLANMQTASWKYTVSGGGIYTVPQPRAQAGNMLFARSDILSEVGANPSPASYQEFLEVMKAVTDPTQHRWAFSAPLRMVLHLQMMLGAPNVWRNENGKFIRDYTDERTKQAIGLVTDMIKAGLFHPDAATARTNFTQTRDYFTSGQVALHSDGYAAWDIFTGQIGDKLAGVAEPKYNGGGDAAHFAGDAAQATTAIRKGLGDDKTRKVLGVLNWLAAPIGTREHLVRKYGIEGKHFTFQNGIPQPTPQGTAEKIDVQYITDAPTILGPGPRDLVTRQHDWHVRITRNLVANDAVGLYSDTDNNKGAQLKKLMEDAMSDIFFGRKPLSAWDDAVTQWRSQGGDKSAQEFAEAAGKA